MTTLAPEDHFSQLAAERRKVDPQAAASASAAALAVSLKRSSGVPAEYKDATLTPPQAAPAKYANVARVLAGLVTQPGIIVLCGANVYQVGKTYLGCAAANLFCERGKSARYVRAMDIFTKIKSTFCHASKRTLEDVESEFRRYELLVIDEMQVRSGTEWEDNLLRAIIDIRSAEQRSTILIANLKNDTLPDYLGAAICKRINKRGGGSFTCAWPEFTQWTTGKES